MNPMLKIEWFLRVIYYTLKLKMKWICNTPSSLIYERHLNRSKLIYQVYIFNEIHQLLSIRISLINKIGGST